jgi:hypothetical protein
MERRQQVKSQALDLALADAETKLNLRSEKHAQGTLAALDDIARQRAEKLLVAHLGHGGFQAFLQAPQPSLGDRTGRDLLSNSPALLLARLEASKCERGEG